jgi:putative membrane protein
MLSPEERERVRAAVDKAEKALSAEIVPCVFAQSSAYPEATWAGAAAGAALACAALFLADAASPLWLPTSTLVLLVPAAGLLGAALGRWCRPVKRFLIGPHRLHEAVARRAKEVFYDRGIDRTKARDGVLLFASLLERRVVVLADEAVRAKVKPEAWRRTVAALTAAAADGRVADGLVAAIEQAAKTLAAAGLRAPRRGRKRGELSDEPVEGDTR